MTKVKRGVSMALIFTMLCSIFCISGLSVDAANTTVKGSCGTNATYTLNKSTGKMVIKAKSGKNGYVKENFLSSLSTANQKAIKTVVIKEGIINIGKYAFSKTPNLKTVKINMANNILVGYGAFSENSNLTSITATDSSLSDKLLSFSEFALYECKNLKTLNLNVDRVYIGKYSFAYCSSLKKFIIPKLHGAVQEGAFENCTSLKKVNIKNTSTIHIADYAFNDCKNLTTFVGSKRVSYIGEYAFSDCSSLEKFNFGENVSDINSYSFCNCKSLTKLSIPKNITSIRAYAFLNCTGLKKVTMYKSTTVFGFAFYNCPCTFKYKS